MAAFQSTKLLVQDMPSLEECPEAWSDVVSRIGHLVVAVTVPAEGMRIAFRFNEATMALIKSILTEHLGGSWTPPDPDAWKLA